jgi:hypothetical protein
MDKVKWMKYEDNGCDKYLFTCCNKTITGRMHWSNKDHFFNYCPFCGSKVSIDDNVMENT